MNKNRIATTIALVSLLVAVAAAAVAAAAYAVAPSEADVARAEIEALVEASYVHGAFNEQNTEAMRSGFHPKFKIHGVADGGLSELPIDTWIGGIEARKAKPGYERQSWTHQLPILDVTGDAAIVKVELFHGDQHVYTDYLSLLKLENGWKITDKVYHRHPDS